MKVLKKFVEMLFGLFGIVLVISMAAGGIFWVNKFYQTRKIRGHYALTEEYSDILKKSIFNPTEPRELTIDSDCMKLKFYISSGCEMISISCGLEVDNDSIFHVSNYSTSFTPACYKQNTPKQEIRLELIYRRDGNKLLLTDRITGTTETYTEL